MTWAYRRCAWCETCRIAAATYIQESWRHKRGTLILSLRPYPDCRNRIPYRPFQWLEDPAPPHRFGILVKNKTRIVDDAPRAYTDQCEPRTFGIEFS